MPIGSPSVLILIPVFNDWDAVRLLIPHIDRAVQNRSQAVSVLLINDASTKPLPAPWNFAQPIENIQKISVMNLRCNLGHQRAIALGLYHAHEFTNADAVLVMDGDGEDRAEDVPKLLDAFAASSHQDAIFAARTKRMEGLGFQLSYHAYRWLHRLLTGLEVRVGNFSVLPRNAVSALMVVPDVWNHFAAAVKRSRLPMQLLPLARGRRLMGQSHMNFVSLLIHGLSALSVYSDRIAARLLAAASVLVASGLALFVTLGWTPASVILLALAGQSLTFAAMFALTIVSRRVSTGFLLLRDAQPFIDTVIQLHPSPSALHQFNGQLAAHNQTTTEAFHP